MTSSNRLQLVERERISPHIEGVDFGGRTFVMVRSPKALLIWVCGANYWSGRGTQNYAGPKMVIFADRSGRSQCWRVYKNIMSDVRLSKKSLTVAWPDIAEVFGDDIRDELFESIRPPRRTLLIEGGGPPLMPDRLSGEAAYQKWRDLPDHGFICRATP